MVVNTYFTLTDPVQLLPRRLDDVSNFGAFSCLRISWQKQEIFFLGWLSSVLKEDILL